jgi:hypothetical protein
MNPVVMNPWSFILFIETIATILGFTLVAYSIVKRPKEWTMYLLLGIMFTFCFGSMLVKNLPQ